jgi:uncharacterized protein
VYVGIAKISLVIGDSHSLKDKRMVLRKIKDRVRDRVGVIVNEVGEQDIWQRAELGCAVVSSDRAKAQELLDEVVRVVMGAGGAEIAAIAKDVSTFEGEAVPYAGKAQADTEWIPDAWKGELDS